MTFIQVIEFRTDDIDRIYAASDEWGRATAGRRTARHSIIARDRHDPSRYFDIVFFDSYDSAMENSRLPETEVAAAAFTAGGPMTFSDLDVVMDRVWTATGWEDRSQL